MVVPLAGARYPLQRHLRFLLKPSPVSSKPPTATTTSSHLHLSATTSLSAAMGILEESDVGISCFLSPLPGFRAILKHRYSDFIVHEVDPDSEIVRLTSFDLPQEDLEEEKEEDEGKLSDPMSRSYLEEIAEFRGLAGEADAELLEGFIGEIAAGKTTPGFFVLSADAEKAHRAEVHGFFKRNLKFLITDTVEEMDGSKRVRVRYARGDGSGPGRGRRKRKSRGERGEGDGRRFDSRGAENWPEHRGKFLRFHLFKENKDTQEALGVVGKMLGIQPRSFGFAGTKDKRAVTTQRVTLFKVRAKRLAALNSRLIGIRVGDFSYVQEGLVLGQLSGNHFTITLRNVLADSNDAVKAAVEQLGKNGFINYFGLQRFGSGSIPTHRIGAALLKGEWQVAVGLVLDPRDGERDAIREVRDYYKENGDIDETLRRLPRYLIAERAILQCLKKCPGNYLHALKAIPRTLRMMYVHSYQSYLWNHAASARVHKYGIGQVVLGDLVLRKGVDQSVTRTDNSVQLQTPDDSYEGDDSGMNELLDPEVMRDDVLPVKVVNSDDLLQNCYTIEDVVLPLPGSRITYPSNDVAEVYYELADKDGIVLSDPVHGAKEFSITNMTGGFRRVFQKPIDFSWELLKYTDPDITLADTDADAISVAEGSNTTQNGNHHEKGGFCDKDIGTPGGIEKCDLKEDAACKSESQISRTALKLSFTLPSSSYATMAIRELLKISTSAAFQKKMNSSEDTMLS